MSTGNSGKLNEGKFFADLRHVYFQTEIMCGTSYTLLVQTPTRTLRPVTYVWVNATDGKSSHLRIYSAQTTQQINLKELGTIMLSSCCVRSTIFVPGTNSGVATQNPDEPLKSDLVWVATDDRRILFYAAADPERGSEIGRIVLPSDPVILWGSSLGGNE